MKHVSLKNLRIGDAFELDSKYPSGVFVKVRGGARPGCGGELIRFAPTTLVRRYVSCEVPA